MIELIKNIKEIHVKLNKIILTLLKNITHHNMHKDIIKTHQIEIKIRMKQSVICKNRICVEFDILIENTKIH
jgi:hypothetical protein